MLELGKKARDKITGFSGVLTGRASYLTGCDQYVVAPPVKPDGSLDDGRWFDESRLEIIGDAVSPQDVQGERKGGPAGNAPVK